MRGTGISIALALLLASATLLEASRVEVSYDDTVESHESAGYQPAHTHQVRGPVGAPRRAANTWTIDGALLLGEDIGGNQLNFFDPQNADLSLGITVENQNGAISSDPTIPENSGWGNFAAVASPNPFEVGAVRVDLSDGVEFGVNFNLAPGCPQNEECRRNGTGEVARDSTQATFTVDVNADGEIAVTMDVGAALVGPRPAYLYLFSDFFNVATTMADLSNVTFVPEEPELPENPEPSRKQRFKPSILKGRKSVPAVPRPAPRQASRKNTQKLPAAARGGMRQGATAKQFQEQSWLVNFFPPGVDPVTGADLPGSVAITMFLENLAAGTSTATFKLDAVPTDAPTCASGVCCNADGTFKNGTVCRAAKPWSCKKDAVCDGINPDCPASNPNKANGIHCPWSPPHHYFDAQSSNKDTQASPDSHDDSSDYVLPSGTKSVPAYEAAAWLTGSPQYDTEWPDCRDLGKCIDGSCALRWNHPHCCFVHHHHHHGHHYEEAEAKAEEGAPQPQAEGAADISSFGYWKSRDWFCFK